MLTSIQSILKLSRNCYYCTTIGSPQLVIARTSLISSAINFFYNSQVLWHIAKRDKFQIIEEKYYNHLQNQNNVWQGRQVVQGIQHLSGRKINNTQLAIFSIHQPGSAKWAAPVRMLHSRNFLLVFLTSADIYLAGISYI